MRRLAPFSVLLLLVAAAAAGQAPIRQSLGADPLRAGQNAKLTDGFLVDNGAALTVDTNSCFLETL